MHASFPGASWLQPRRRLRPRARLCLPAVLCAALMALVHAGESRAASPAAISTSPGRLDVFARDGGNGQLLWTTWDWNASSPRWSEWTPVGGTLLRDSNISVLKTSAGKLAVFVVGQDHAVWRYELSQATRAGSLSKVGGYSTGGVTAVSAWSGREDVFVGGYPDSAGRSSLFHSYASTSGDWAAWSNLGGYLLPGTGPSAVSRATGDIDVAITGQDRSAYQYSWHENPAWGTGPGWTLKPLNGELTGGPALSIGAVGAKGRIDIAARGVWGGTYTSYFDTGLPAAWAGQGGCSTFGSTPAALWWKPNTTAAYQHDIFTIGLDGQIEQRTWLPSGGWQAWTRNLPAITASRPTRPCDSQIPTSILYGGADGAVETTSEADAVIARLRSTSDADATNIAAGLAPTDRAIVHARAEATIRTSFLCGGANMKVDTAAEADGVIHNIRAAIGDAASMSWLSELHPSDRDVVTSRMDSQWPSSRGYGGSNWRIDTSQDAERFASANRQASETDQAGLLAGLHPEDRNYVASWIAPESLETEAEVAEFSSWLGAPDETPASQAARFGLEPFSQLVDAPHISSSEREKGRDAINVHAGWRAGGPHGARSLATVTVWLQQHWGGWQTIRKIRHENVPPGWGSGEWVSTDQDCTIYPGLTYSYRAIVDVDVKGYMDDIKKRYSPIGKNNCSRLGRTR